MSFVMNKNINCMNIYIQIVDIHLQITYTVGQEDKKKKIVFVMLMLNYTDLFLSNGSNYQYSY